MNRKKKNGKKLHIGVVLMMTTVLLSCTGCMKDADDHSLSSDDKLLEAGNGYTSDNSLESDDNYTDAPHDLSGRPYANDGTGVIKDLQEGDVAPDFSAELTDGTTFRLSEHDDEIVLLNFFATWCGPCMGEMPAFEQLKLDGYENLTILCVDCMEDAGIVDQFVRESGYTFPIAYDEQGIIEAYYPTDGIPYTLVIDHGIIQRIFIGAYSADEQYQEYKSAIDACVQDSGI